MHKDPASSVIDELGGPTKVSALLDLDRSTVVRWRMAKAKGGTDGLIPSRYVFDLMRHLAASGSKLVLEQVVLTSEQRAALAELSGLSSESAYAASLNKNGKIIP